MIIHIHLENLTLYWAHDIWYRQKITDTNFKKQGYIADKHICYVSLDEKSIAKYIDYGFYFLQDIHVQTPLIKGENVKIWGNMAVSIEEVRGTPFGDILEDFIVKLVEKKLS